MPNIKNIIIFVGIGLVMVLAYVFFVKGDAEPENLVSGTPTSSAETPEADSPGNAIGQEFLGLLLNVKNIKLDDAIFSSPAFASLIETSILLQRDGTEGRPNPFAPIGVDVLPASAVPSATLPPSTNTTVPPALPPTGGATDDNGL